VTSASRPVICLVTDRQAAAPSARTLRDELAALDDVLDAAIEAAIDLIQVRERGIDSRTLVDFVRRLATRTRGTATRIVLNDRVDVAIVAGAEGVHLKSDGPRAVAVRRLVGQRFIGRSIHDPSGIDPDADYLMFGTVFTSDSKPPGAPVAGVRGLADIVALTSVPVYAIGGITPENAGECLRAGAAGVAAIRAFLPAARTKTAIAEFRST